MNMTDKLEDDRDKENDEIEIIEDLVKKLSEKRAQLASI